VKVIKLGMDTREVLARFELERLTLSRMDHSHIARVLDAGVTDNGRPYFVMEYVPGLPLVRYCDERKLSVRARLELFLQVCDAVQHAHQKGVIHRDLTPRNILVKEENDKPVPKVIDFGLARAVDHTGAMATVFTEQGRIIGTPEYMSPEQAGLSPFDVDTRTDVYSLGVILYELMVGELPIASQDLRKAGMLEMQRRIREEDPVPPSMRLGDQTADSELHARDRGTTTHRLRRLVSQDLDWIALRALEKDRRRRYPTAQSLAEDLLRYLRNEPVLAGPPSVGYRLRKWLERHTVGVTAGGIALACLLGGLAASVTFWRQAAAAERETRLDADADLAAELLRAKDDDLWPTDSTQVDAMQVWLERARPLVARRAEHEPRLAAATAAAAVAAPGPERIRAELAVRRAERLVADLAKLSGQDGIADLEQRLQEARSLRQRSVDANADAWQRAAAAVAADPRFPGVRLEPIEGLVPLGTDEGSSLEEFLVLGTGERPARIGRRLVPGPRTGIVLVLLPPGSFDMGGGDDPPVPPRRVALDAFLLGKYEITQGQWLRLAGSNPSNWRNDEHPESAFDLPVENISLARAERILGRVGLQVTTQGQWEYACRAGDGDLLPWGSDRSSVGAHANVVDLTALDHFRREGQLPEEAAWPGLDKATCRDGFVGPAPVGRFAANAFGLHDMFGNVHEWCRGDYVEPPTDGVRDGDGLVGANRLPLAVVRGGGYTTSEKNLRPAFFRAVARHNFDPSYGVRPARPLRR
jgi:formylglycine-generating enzyme required for sulfatase activity